MQYMMESNTVWQHAYPLKRQKKYSQHKKSQTKKRQQNIMSKKITSK